MAITLLIVQTILIFSLIATNVVLLLHTNINDKYSWATFAIIETIVVIVTLWSTKFIINELNAKRAAALKQV